MKECLDLSRTYVVGREAVEFTRAEIMPFSCNELCNDLASSSQKQPVARSTHILVA